MKKTLIILSLALAVLSAGAETVSQKQAQQLAHLFFNEAAGSVTAPPKLIYNGRRLTTNRLFNPFYVYNTAKGGFVIVSAENKAFPILGYSLKESFDPDRLGEIEKALLQSYANEIELIRYDSEPVEGAIHAWQDLPGYISGILESKYIATDPKITLMEAENAVADAEERDDAIYADIYTPSQWQEMIETELAARESVPVVVWTQSQDYPMVIYGKQGDYFRIEMTRRNSWLMRLNATEIIPANMITTVGNPLPNGIAEEEQQPFAEHDNFLWEVEAAEQQRNQKASIDRPLIDGTPMIKGNGSGHFEITLPDNAKFATVYNLMGGIVARNTYRDTPVVNIDISAEPSGFYFVMIGDESGTRYGFKLYR